MKNIKLASRLVILVLSLHLYGCVPHRFYHCPSGSSVHHQNHSLATIELDELGELWRPQQITAATKAVRERNSPDKPVFLVVFIHGWKHNAAANDGNFSDYKNFIAALGQPSTSNKMENPIARKYQVVGVYVGWRGAVTTVPYVEHLTFWSRKNAAHRVAGTSATEAIFTLMAAARENPRSKVVLIGHSFGGLVMEKTVSQAMIGAMLSQKPTNGTVRPPADLTLLVNSAAESVYAKQFIQMLQRRGPDSGLPQERPWIVSVTSVGDKATKWAFPIGMTLGSLTRSFRSYEQGTNTCPSDEPFAGSQRAFYIRTAGHNERLFSHRLKYVGSIAEAATNRAIQASVTDLWQNLSAEGKERFKVGPDLYDFQPIPDAVNRTPYWVMQLPKAILADHGGVLKREFWAFAAALFRRSELQEPETSPTTQMHLKSL